MHECRCNNKETRKKQMTVRRACKNVSFSLLLFCLLYKSQEKNEVLHYMILKFIIIFNNINDNILNN